MIRAAVRRDLPSGTVTFLFTDVEGSTRLLHELGAEGYATALAEHRRAIREACAQEGGVEVDTQGDAFFFAFPRAPDAVAAASAMTESLKDGPVQVRVGLHTGTPLVAAEGYVGDDVHFAARVAASGHGGQVILSAATARALEPSDTVSQGLLDLGEHRLRDIADAVSIFQLGDGSFPPLKTISNTNLPRPASSFVGREAEFEDVLSRIGDGARLVTLTGPGGTGKTRLAIEVASTLVPEYMAGVFWVGLASLRDPTLVTETISQTLGARDGLAEHIGERELLLLLDNLEQVVEAAPELSELLQDCPNLTLLVTSRELLRISGEVEYAVPPLASPEAIELFCERSQLEPTDEIAQLCARLDSLPLAVELAAARTKALTPAQILERLSSRLDLLKGGRDADPRQQTLRATIEWSYELLAPDERLLFARLSVFAGGCTLEAAENVADAAVDTLQSLVEKSLVRFSQERYWMLETVREYAAERLEPGDVETVRRRLRDFMVARAEESAPRLFTADESETSAALELEFANFRSGVQHALAAGEPDDVGRIVDALYPFLITRGHMAEAGEWVVAALEARDRLSERGLGATLSGGGEILRFAGDLDGATEFKRELLSIPGRSDSAATYADLAEIALDQREYEAARRYAEQSAAAGGGARVSLAMAELSLRTGDLEGAEANALAALAGLQEGEFNHACALEIMAETARRSGRAAEAGDHFRKALRGFAVLRDPGGVADCLDGLARLALESDRETAARLRGAADALREDSRRRPIRSDVPPPDVPESARQAGLAFSLENAVEFALGSID
jgi:predicted ATPase/class 3 adenylate cyclase